MQFSCDRLRDVGYECICADDVCGLLVRFVVDDVEIDRIILLHNYSDRITHNVDDFIFNSCE